jgi:CNT family concentrative nucleoside transporter
MEFLRGAFGIIVIVLVAFIFSVNRKKIDWRLVAIGISLQLAFGFLITQVEVVKIAFQFISEGFVKFLSFSEAGARFIFGDLAGDSFGFIFALRFFQPSSSSPPFPQACITWGSCKRSYMALLG